jgi:NADH-quinone oxidoreductase subunit G
MNRCIHCYRCVRFYQEYSGYHDLGAMGIASRVYFGRFTDGALHSPFAGNLIDICPTGVYTDKPSRYQARRWDLQRAPSICLHCSLGCNTLASAHYGEVIRLEGRESPRVNGAFICDRGRYGFSYANRPDRPRQAMVDGEPVAGQQGVAAAAVRLQGIADDHGPGAIAVLGSARNSHETQLLLRHLCQQGQWQAPRFFVNDREASAAHLAARLDSRLATSRAEIEQADFVVVVGCDPVHEAPMLALAMRQAARQGATIVLLDPRPVELPFAFALFSLVAGDLPTALALLVRSAMGQSGSDGLSAQEKACCQGLPEGLTDVALQQRVVAAATGLAASKRPVLICGTDLPVPGLPELAAALALLLHGANPGARLLYPLPGANAFGAGLLQEGDHDFSSLLHAMEKGQVRALLVVEQDPFFRYADLSRLRRALGKLDLLVVIDYLATPLHSAATIFLPSATVFEAGGSFINSSGLLQHATAVHDHGLPLGQRLEQGHPSRAYTPQPLAGRCPSASELLLALARELAMPVPTAAEPPCSLLAEDYPGKANVVGQGNPLDGWQLPLATGESKPLHPSLVPPAAEGGADGLTVVLVERTFGSEELSSASAPLRQLAGRPYAYLHTSDAARLGLSEAEGLTLRIDGKQLDLELRIREEMAPGQLIVARHYQLQAAELNWPDTLSAAQWQQRG